MVSFPSCYFPSSIRSRPDRPPLTHVAASAPPSGAHACALLIPFFHSFPSGSHICQENGSGGVCQVGTAEAFPVLRLRRRRQSCDLVRCGGLRARVHGVVAAAPRGVQSHRRGRDKGPPRRRWQRQHPPKRSYARLELPAAMCDIVRESPLHCL
uniref:Uncharacterized protein n=1 Tax=Arundo donax TaxID=35708 RepID=A0A0A9GUY1_ARUDO